MTRREPMAADETGRYAEAVTEIPRKGWRAVLSRTVDSVSRDNLSLIAGGATFFLLLAIFPAIASFVSLYGLIYDPSAVTQQLDALRGLLPSAALDLLSGELERLTAQPGSSLGVGFVLGLAVSLWSANAGMKALFAAMNVAYDEDEDRGFVRLTLTSLAFTLAALVGAAVLLFVIVAIPAVIGNLGLGSGTQWAVAIVRWPLLALVLVGGLGVLYKFSASRAAPRWRWISWGTVLTAALWVVVSAIFSFYLSNFANYNATYGSLGAVIGFMMWLYVSLMIVLVGATLNAEIEQQVATDTTSGPFKPMGRRDAVKADTLPNDA